jgi:hypothetical protein
MFNYNELGILYYLTLSIVSVLFILLVYLTIRKTIANNNRKKIEQYKEKYNSLIFLFLTGQTLGRELNPVSNLQQRAVEELLNKYTTVLEGEEERQRLTELAKLYMSNYYKKRLKSRRWSIRMNTLYNIEDFNMVSLADEVYSLTARKRITTEELVHVLRILALFRYPQMLELLTIRFNQFSEYEYRNILTRLQMKDFDQLVLHFHKSPISLQKATLDVISIKKEITYITFIENIFSSYSGEIRLRAIKALAEIGYVKDIDPYLELLYSSRWEERMVAAKLVGTLKEEKGLFRLIELLHDSSWWVRSQAGQAISQFSNGKEILQMVLETSMDVFAKDMAWEWLQKGV